MFTPNLLHELQGTVDSERQFILRHSVAGASLLTRRKLNDLNVALRPFCRTGSLCVMAEAGRVFRHAERCFDLPAVPGDRLKEQTRELHGH